MFSYAHGTSLHEPIAHVSKVKGKVIAVNKVTNTKIIMIPSQK